MRITVPWEPANLWQPRGSSLFRFTSKLQRNSSVVICLGDVKQELEKIESKVQGDGLTDSHVFWENALLNLKRLSLIPETSCTKHFQPFAESGNHKNWYVYLSPKRALQVYVLLVLTTSDTVCPHVIYLILLVPVVSGWLAWPEKPTLTLRGSISCAISASVAASSQFSSFLASRYSSEMLWVCLR